MNLAFTWIRGSERRARRGRTDSARATVNRLGPGDFRRRCRRVDPVIVELLPLDRSRRAGERQNTRRWSRAVTTIVSKCSRESKKESCSSQLYIRFISQLIKNWLKSIDSRVDYSPLIQKLIKVHWFKDWLQSIDSKLIRVHWFDNLLQSIDSKIN